MPKSRSPSRRAKSRWEPVPDEKVVDKSVNISYGPVKYGGWNNKQVLMTYEKFIMSYFIILVHWREWRMLDLAY